MKHLRRLLCALMVALTLAAMMGCTPSSGSTSSGLTGELTVYYYASQYTGDNLYANVIEQFQQSNPGLTLHATPYSDEPALCDLLLSQADSGGIKADVVLLSSDCKVDVVTLARKGYLLPLQDQLAQTASYQPDNYVSALLDAGKVEGRQYFLPLGFSTLCEFGSPKRREQCGISAEPQSLSSLLSALVPALENDLNTQGNLSAVSLGGATQYDLTDLLIAANLTLLNPDTMTSAADTAALTQVLEDYGVWQQALRAYIENYEKDGDSATLIWQEFPDRAALAFLTRNPYASTQFYRSVDNEHYGEGLSFVPVPQYNTPDQYSAILTHYGFVSAQAGNKNAALALLQAAMDRPLEASTQEGTPLPVRVDRLAELQQRAAAQPLTDGRILFHNGRYPASVLDEATAEKIGDALSHITAAYLPNPAVEDIFLSCVMPYYQDGSSVQSCLDNFVQQMQDYIEKGAFGNQ
ncbi:MAG: extracellular solute-binding protein [Eubacteriales bacterium]|nr:extracellular solute-binding protein [Eubacteriales bacterium]